MAYSFLEENEERMAREEELSLDDISGVFRDSLIKFSGWREKKS
jgi:hypothetical protein